MSYDPMGTNGAAIIVESISKCFYIYEKPQDRLMHSIMPRLQRAIGAEVKSYGREFWAVTDVSFRLNKGETLGIIGRNGSGKSTLLQLICGTLNPTHGQVQTFGRIAALLELGAGFNPEFTGRENVYLSAAFYGLSRAQTDERFNDIAQFSEIGDYIDQPVKTYSSGMFVRLAFATIAHVDADILIIDEALAVGDAVFTQKCMRFLRSFKKEKTLLFVSHDSNSVIALCDKALWLSEGKLQALGEAKATCEKYLTHILGANNDAAVPEKVFEEISTDRIRRIWAGEQHYEHAAAAEVFKSNIGASEQLGPHGAEIRHVTLKTESGGEVRTLKGGEVLTLSVHAVAFQNLRSPIIGFFVKDRLGQYLFGSNTLSAKNRVLHPTAPGQWLKADFTFAIPWLAQGDYSIQVALADGDQRDHTQHHWIHDAVIFHSSNDPSASGLIGIPMLDIEMNVINQAGK